jgi:hypothetical protein
VVQGQQQGLVQLEQMEQILFLVLQYQLVAVVVALVWAAALLLIMVWLADLAVAAQVLLAVPQLLAAQQHRGRDLLVEMVQPEQVLMVAQAVAAQVQLVQLVRTQEQVLAAMDWLLLLAVLL